MSWIVKNEKPQAQPKPFEDRITDALAEAGITPTDWTDEEIGGEYMNEGWRTISDVWEIRQAAKGEWNKRKGQQPHNTRIWTS